MPRSKVQLYRYDISQGMAAQFSQMMLGIHVEAVWHTAIHAFGREYYFDGGVGIVAMGPGTTRFGHPVRVDDLGETELAVMDFEQWCVQQMRTKYGPADYNLLERNCNHFTQDASMHLVGHGIGDDIITMIDRLLSTPLGQMMRPNLEMMTQGGNQGLQPLSAPSAAPAAAPPASGTAAATPSAAMPSASVNTTGTVSSIGTHPISDDEQDALMLAVSLIESEDDKPDLQLACVSTLLTVIGNIMDNPTMGKFRRIGTHTKAFQKKIQPIGSATELLVAVGFVEVRDTKEPEGKNIFYELSSGKGNMALLRAARAQLDTMKKSLETALGVESTPAAAPSWRWVPTQGPRIPEDALPAGKEGNGQALYIGRDPRDGALGKCGVHLNGCNVPRNGKEEHITNFEVLCVAKADLDKVCWVPRAAFESPEDAFKVAVPSTNGIMVRGGNGDGVHPGWWSGQFHAPCVPYGGQAQDISTWTTFEVLCSSNLSADLKAKSEQHAASTALLNKHYSQCCAPINSIVELWEWEAPSREETMKPSPLIPKTKRPSTRSADEPDRPNILVCHDFKGGFLTDNDAAAFAGPGATNKPQDGAYTTAYWHMIDTFCYFSHSRVGIPPREWIDAAHKNGVQIIGTFITEWELGEKECRLMLGSESFIERTVSQLVKIAQHFGFDGWLINIENPLHPTLVPKMQHFAASLTKAMHQALWPSKGLTIWYDAVTTEGSLKWQNMLNDKNKAFFDVCDGIFLNYHWTPMHLQQSAAVSGPRKKDVYVGIDVFGRGTFGGGGLQSSSAFIEIFETDLSVAMFAPGWTRESTNSTEEFKEKDRQLWGSLEGFCNAAEVPRQLPLATHFHPSSGTSYFVNGLPIAQQSGFVQLGAAQIGSNHLAVDCSITKTNDSTQRNVGRARRLITSDAFNGAAALELDLQLAETSKRYAAVEVQPLDIDNAQIDNGLTIALAVKAQAPHWFLVEGKTAAGQSMALALAPSGTAASTPNNNTVVVAPNSADVINNWQVSQWVVPVETIHALKMNTLTAVSVLDGSPAAFLAGEDNDGVQQDLSAGPQDRRSILLGHVSIVAGASSHSILSALPTSENSHLLPAGSATIHSVGSEKHMISVTGVTADTVKHASEATTTIALFLDAPNKESNNIFLGRYDVASLPTSPSAAITVPFTGSLPSGKCSLRLVLVGNDQVPFSIAACGV